jgi:hypothetical protein
MADGGTGYRRVVQLGNAQLRTSWTFEIPPGIYYWSAQSIDGAYAGSPFAAEGIFERFREGARIDGIVDVPNDQGRQVRISWARSAYDYAESPTPVTEYAIYRKFDEDLESPLPVARAEAASDLKSPALYPPGDWTWIVTLPACAEDDYAAVVPTLADSTISDGMYYTTFFVRALTDDPAVHFDSEPDSGYSVDNLEPTAPQGLTAGYDGEAIVLDWDENPEEDFNYYAIYRGTDESFEPDTPIGYSTTETYVDNELPSPGEYWYKITATDFSGNESDPSLPASANVTGVADAEVHLPTVFFLGPAIPNPFNPVTEITYGIPTGSMPSRVMLQVYDATGREVAALVNADQEPGEYKVAWDGRDHKGAEVASGVYFCRIRWNGESRTNRMVLLK